MPIALLLILNCDVFC